MWCGMAVALHSHVPCGRLNMAAQSGSHATLSADERAMPRHARSSSSSWETRAMTSLRVATRVSLATTELAMHSNVES